MTDLSDRTLAQASCCPRCEAPATPGPSTQICVHCKKPFVLVAGPRINTALTTGQGARKPVKVTYGEAVMRYAATVDESGVTCAELDPVTGRIAVGKRAVAFADIASIGLYRRIDWVMLVLLVLVFFVPVVVPLWLATFASSFLIALLALPATALFALGLKKSIGIGVQRMRLASARARELPIVVRFDSPMWKRKRFLDAVLTGSGVGPVEWDG